MKHSPVRAAALAAGLALPIALAGCSGDEPQAATSSSTSTPAATSSTSSTTPSSSSTASSTTSSTSSSSTTSSRTTSTSASSSKPFDHALAGSCLSAVTKVNSTTRQWNSAQRSGDAGRLDTAARRMGTTASELRGLARSNNAGFNERARTVATELDKMKDNRLKRKDVATGDFNIAQRSLHRYCSAQLKG